jgi:hypothetical protein
LKDEQENNKDKNKSSLWDMSEKSFESVCSNSEKYIPASINPNKRFLLLEFFNKKIREDMSNEWSKLLGSKISEYSKRIHRQSSLVTANWVILSAEASETYRDVINGALDNEQDVEQNENL